MSLRAAGRGVASAFNVNRGYFKVSTRDTTSSAKCRFFPPGISVLMDWVRFSASVLDDRAWTPLVYIPTCPQSLLFVCGMTALVHPVLVTLTKAPPSIPSLLLIFRRNVKEASLRRQHLQDRTSLLLERRARPLSPAALISARGRGNKDGHAFTA